MKITLNSENIFKFGDFERFLLEQEIEEDALWNAEVTISGKLSYVILKFLCTFLDTKLKKTAERSWFDDDNKKRQNPIVLKSVTLYTETESIGAEYCFFELFAEQLIIGEGVKNIGENTFLNCKGIKKLVLPSTMQKIHKDAFSYSNFHEIIIPENNKWFYQKDEGIYSSFSNTLVAEIGSIIQQFNKTYPDSDKFFKHNQDTHSQTEDKELDEDKDNFEDNFFDEELDEDEDDIFDEELDEDEDDDLQNEDNFPKEDMVSLPEQIEFKIKCNFLKSANIDIYSIETYKFWIEVYEKIKPNLEPTKAFFQGKTSPTEKLIAAINNDRAKVVSNAEVDDIFYYKDNRNEILESFEIIKNQFLPSRHNFVWQEFFDSKTEPKIVSYYTRINIKNFEFAFFKLTPYGFEFSFLPYNILIFFSADELALIPSFLNYLESNFFSLLQEYKKLAKELAERQKEAESLNEMLSKIGEVKDSEENIKENIDKLEKIATRCDFVALQNSYHKGEKTPVSFNLKATNSQHIIEFELSLDEIDYIVNQDSTAFETELRKHAKSFV